MLHNLRYSMTNIVFSRTNFSLFKNRTLRTTHGFICCGIILSLHFLSGCSILPHVDGVKDKKVKNNIDAGQRALALTRLAQWQIQGKIAFIEKKERNSANISWAVDKKNATQRLHLTSYLGINVLQLMSKDNLHTITFDGKTYSGNDLQGLIYSLTGFTFPVVALESWLIGLPYQQGDIIDYNEATALPMTLTSNYNDNLWQINYAKYKQFNQHLLATKLSIKQGDLVIKVSINQWNLLHDTQ